MSDFDYILLKIEGEMRAFQIGTISRGIGCASFNSPGIFGSIKKSFSWIKETVENEMKNVGYCSASDYILNES